MPWIALLRGINVGGHTVKMEAMRRLFAELGLAHVRSSIQTGNLSFDGAEDDRAALRRRLEAHLGVSLGYAVPVCLRTVEELGRVVALEPFQGVEVTADVRLSVLFLAELAAVDLPVPYQAPKGDFALVGKTDAELFVVWHLVKGRPGNGFVRLEKSVPVPTTTRFWQTTAKILEGARRP